MTNKKAIDIMTRLQAEYFFAFKDMPEKLFSVKVKNFKESLKGCSDEEIEIAMKILLKESEVFPTTASFIKVIERNRELVVPSTEEVWSMTMKVVNEMRTRCENYNAIWGDLVEYRSKQRKSYESLPDEVKEFFVDYEGFLDVVYSDKIEIEKNKFIKNFPEFRKKKKQREELKKYLENEQWTEK